MTACSKWEQTIPGCPQHEHQEDPEPRPSRRGQQGNAALPPPLNPDLRHRRPARPSFDRFDKVMPSMGRHFQDEMWPANATFDLPITSESEDGDSDSALWYKVSDWDQQHFRERKDLNATPPTPTPTAKPNSKDIVNHESNTMSEPFPSGEASFATVTTIQDRTGNPSSISSKPETGQDHSTARSAGKTIDIIQDQFLCQTE